MEITSTQVKALRDRTGISVMQCKKALEEAGGDEEKAFIILKKRRQEAAEKKSDRELGAGIIGVYVHNTNEVAAMVRLSCETDFVAKNKEFADMARDIAMHVTALSPSYISREDVSPEVIEKAKSVFEAEIADKPEDMREKIMKGKIDSYFAEQILLEQSFIKNPEMKISDMIQGAVQKFGENVAITDISRLSVK